MVVRVPEQERKRLVDQQEKHKQLRLESFVKQIQTSKSEYNGRQLRSANKLKLNSQIGGKYGSHMSTSSGGENDAIKLQPRHFKNKEGAIFLNMFETISTNYCLNNKNSQQKRLNHHQRSNQSITHKRGYQTNLNGLDMSQIPEELVEATATR